MKKFIKKNWGNIVFLVLIVLLIIPQTRMPIQVGLQKLISFSPSEIDVEDRELLNDYRWNLTSLNDEKINFTQSKGKVVLINYWATWCPPCIAEMPDLQELYNKYADQVDFYFVSSEEKEILNLFLEKKNYNLPVYIQTEKSPDLIETTSLPTSFLISKSGEIVMRKTGAANWNSNTVHETIESLLKE
ncbi:MAG: TlpA family protein disulfide reductase [Flavobacteriaceae bacterium]|nr:TlpA family protein disulfide reductase [Flavobacteriaceae bacterium]